MKIAIHQPNYLPYLGFFKKVSLVDTFVFLDDVQYTRGGFTNRNRIKTPSGMLWLTVPIKNVKFSLINQIVIVKENNWRRDHLKSLEAYYRRAAFYDELKNLLSEIYSRIWERLIDLNIFIIKKCFELLEINVETVLSSSLEINVNSASERIIEICKHLRASEYLSGASGQKYLPKDKFKKDQIELNFLEFKHPVYPQRFGEFIPNLAVIDYLMNVGPHKF